MAEKTYELAADSFDMVTSKPGDPAVRFTTYTKGDEVKVDEDRAKRLIALGALVDPNAKKEKDGDTPGPSRAPKGKGDPAQAPQGSGSTTTPTPPAGSSGAGGAGDAAGTTTPTA